MIRKAISLKIPVVNVKWMNDILLGEKISLQHFTLTKYQKYDLSNPYHINYNKVSHLMGMLKMNQFFYIFTNFTLFFSF